MNLYVLSMLALLYAVVVSVMVFLSYRQRLQAVTADAPLNLNSVQQLFKSTQLERLLGYGLLALLGYLVWQTIQQGFDFALLMMGATLFTGLVWYADRRLTKKLRADIINRAAKEIDQFDATTDRATLEPGIIENSRAFFPILICVFLLRSFLVEPFQIPSGSMKPTLEIRDFILVNRFAYGLRMPLTNQVIVPIALPQRGDVIIFKPPHEPNKNYIKRVVAIPGDEVFYDYRNKQLFVNGERANTEFLQVEINDEVEYLKFIESLDANTNYSIYKNSANGGLGLAAYGWLREPVTVPAGKYFVMGDNRDNSLDARYWESLRLQQAADNGEDWRFVDESDILGRAWVVWMHWERFYPTFSRNKIIR